MPHLITDLPHFTVTPYHFFPYYDSPSCPLFHSTIPVFLFKLAKLLLFLLERIAKNPKKALLLFLLDGWN